MNVAAEARKLAFRYGVDPDRAYAAGLLHDICKEEDNGELKRLMLNCGNITNAELASKPLWHAPAGSFLYTGEFGRRGQRYNKRRQISYNRQSGNVRA